MDLTLIHQPDHYVKGRNIQPISVIEDWGLCHHLACVVKYLARCGRKQDAHQDLLKAHWYLNRKIELLAADTHRCPVSVIHDEEITLTAVLHDWHLSSNLELVLSYVKPSLLRGTRFNNLNQALIYLEQEIQNFEEWRLP